MQKRKRLPALFQDDQGIWQFNFARNKSPNLCKVLYCSNPSPHFRTGGVDRNRVCNKCRSRRWRLNNPMRASWGWLQISAKKRRIEFRLSYDEFAAFVSTTRYMEEKGRTGNCLSIDRIDNTRGYEPGNLQILTISENVVKQREDTPRKPPEPEDDNCPF